MKRFAIALLIIISPLLAQTAALHPDPGGAPNPFWSRPFPVQIMYGVGVNGGSNNASHLALSYAIYRGAKGNGYRNRHRFFRLHPVLTVGMLDLSRENQLSTLVTEFESENGLYAMLEGHWRWGTKYVQTGLFLGAGAGGYGITQEETDEFGGYTELPMEEGFGLVGSAGLQLRTRTLITSLSLLRSPGLGEIIMMASVGFQPRTYKKALVMVGGSLAAIVVFLLLVPGN